MNEQFCLTVFVRGKVEFRPNLVDLYLESYTLVSMFQALGFFPKLPEMTLKQTNKNKTSPFFLGSRLTHPKYFLTSAFCCSRLFVVTNTFLYMRSMFLISLSVKSSKTGTENRVNINEAFESMPEMKSAERLHRLR